MQPDTISQLEDVGTIGMAVYVLVEIIKRAGFPSRYCGLLSILLGVVIGFVAAHVTGEHWLDGVIAGFWGAASASGIYSGSKSLFKPRYDSELSEESEDYVPPAGC